jgi:hypothetical protein
MKMKLYLSLMLFAVAIAVTAPASALHREGHPTVIIKTMPASHTVVVIEGVRYFSHGGNYYVPYRGHYRRVNLTAARRRHATLRFKHHHH